MRRVPLRVYVARETGTGITGGWVAPATRSPCRKRRSIRCSRAFQIRRDHPALARTVEAVRSRAEATIRHTVLGGLAASLDNQFLLATVAAVANTNPAAMTNGSTEITSTGRTAAQIAADLAACWRRSPRAAHSCGS